MSTESIQNLIIILGSPNRNDGRLFDVAISRCKLGLSVYKKYKDKKSNCKILLTGGYGEHFNQTNKPHAYYLEQYLIKAGVPKSDILEYAERSNSNEDAFLSKRIVDKYNVENIIIITSDYHLERAKFIFNKVYKDLSVDISFLGSPTDEEHSKLDIKALKSHEEKAMDKLRQYGVEGYYKR